MNDFEHILLTIAKQAIQEVLENKTLINKADLVEQFPLLLNSQATFVTLNSEGKLRGCIGSLIAYQTLIDDLISNAKNAAFKDPRFPPLTKEEFKKVDIEVSILSTPTKVNFSSIEDLKSQVQVGVDGLIIKQNNLQGTFLPQVWEQLPTFELFLEHLFAKANITDISQGFEIYKYQVKKIK